MKRARGTKIAAAAAVGLALLSAAIPQKSGALDLMPRMGFPYAAFDSMPQTDLHIPGAVIHVAFGPGVISLPKERVFAWIRRSARAVSTYYGHFPVKSFRLLIMPTEGSGVDGGTTWGYKGAATRIIYGAASSEDDLLEDWVMVHEMTHLALPDLSDRYNWLSEGLAVYIEPIARVQAGDLRAESIWFAMWRDMPKGEPRPGDRGLDNTQTWGRTYWGGALFCLLADIEIRKQTANRLGLQDAMRGVLAYGNHEQNWSIEEVLQTADRSVGLHVLSDLYRKMGPKPMPMDLADFWRQLGVEPGDDSIRFNDAAPLAAERAAVTKPHV